MPVADEDAVTGGGVGRDKTAVGDADGSADDGGGSVDELVVL